MFEIQKQRDWNCRLESVPVVSGEDFFTGGEGLSGMSGEDRSGGGDLSVSWFCAKKGVSVVPKTLYH